jgi:hypothetical protein
MTTLALVFLVLSWSGVLGLAAWSFHRVLRADSRRPPDESGRSG